LSENVQRKTWNKPPAGVLLKLDSDGFFFSKEKRRWGSSSEMRTAG